MQPNSPQPPNITDGKDADQRGQSGRNVTLARWLKEVGRVGDASAELRPHERAEENSQISTAEHEFAC